jgi:hypothetical protein
MCVYIGLYYPVDKTFENCAAASGTRNSAATYIGSGTASCGDTFTCVSKAKDQATLYSCVVNACPQVAAVETAALDCSYATSHGSGACHEVCSTGGDCQTCILQQCGNQIGACLNAGCN